MARVTVEDCLEREENRFAMVVLAANRTRQLMKGAEPLVRSKNKPAVTSLREIAGGKVHFHRNSTEVVLERLRQQAAAPANKYAAPPLLVASRSAARRGRARPDRELEAGSSAHYREPDYYTATYKKRLEDVTWYVDRAVSRGGSVLELGCGNGRITIPLARHGVAV